MKQVERYKHAERWHDVYQQLLEYKEAHGHVHVPTSEGFLGGWVHRQRVQHEKKTLAADKLALLREAGEVKHVVH
jgi:hypothetical protein